MNRSMGFIDKVALAADLPSEAFGVVPIIEIIGGNRVLVEHHLGILAYGLEQIIIKSSIGSIRISGSDLQLISMTKDQLIITGVIKGIILTNGGCE